MTLKKKQNRSSKNNLLPKLPPEWEWVSLKHLCSTFADYGLNVSSENYREEGIRLIRTTDISDLGILHESNAVFLDPPVAEDTRLMDGDILLSRSGTVGRAFRYDSDMHGPCTFASYLVRFRLGEDYNSAFLSCYFQSSVFDDLVKVESTQSTISNVSGNKFANFPVPKAPLGISEHIVQYIDQQTTRIDALLEKKNHLLELLAEKRQTIVTRAITKGLDRDAEMVDSEIPWFGDIPAHWGVSKVKFEFQNKDNERVPVSASERDKMQGRYPYYGASGIIDYVDDYLFKGPHILLGEDGANLLSRSKRLAFIADGKFWANNHAHVLVPLEGDLWYYSELLEIIDYANEVRGAAQPKLTANALGDKEVLIPPIEEQKAIKNNTKPKLDTISDVKERLKESINILKEKRQALVTAAVTGQIDVSDWEPSEQEAPA